MFDIMTSAPSVDSLEHELLTCEADRSRLAARQVDLLRRLDLAQVAITDGCKNMVDWVASRLDVSHRAAQDLLVVARARKQTVDRLLESGEIGLERAVALVKLADTGSSERTIADSFGLDLAGLWRLVGIRQRLNNQAEQYRFSQRHLVMQPSLDESWWKLWGGLPGIDGQVVEKALLQRADSNPFVEGEGRPQRMADALTTLALDSLTGSGADAIGRQVTVAEVFVDGLLAASTSGEAGVRLSTGPKVGPQALSEILCSGQVRVIVEDGGGRLIDYSDLGEAIPPAIRALVWKRDQGVCAIDGCRSRYRLQPQHIAERSRGGSHDPDNLTLLCWFHHHVAIHGLGFRFDPESPPRRRRLLRQRNHSPPS
jgi:hypothetical protein